MKVPLLEEIQNDERDAQCTFIHHPEGFHGADLSTFVDEAPMQMRQEMPLEVVISTFQKMVCTLYAPRYNKLIIDRIYDPFYLQNQMGSLLAC